MHTHFFVSKSFTNSLDMYFKILKTLLSVQYPELFWSRYTGLGFQTFESVKINSSEKRQMTDRCLELFRMQTTQNFQGIYPWTPLGRAYSAPRPPDPQLHYGFLLVTLVKKPAFPKNCRMKSNCGIYSYIF